MRRTSRRLAWIVACAASLLLWGGVALGQTTYEDFEGPDPSWQNVVSSTRSRIEVQERTPQDPHGGARCEFVQVATGAADGYVYLAHEVPAARVIDELKPSVWVRADRPVVQLRARVVLPHAVDPNTGRAATVVVDGTSYTRTGGWQRLSLDNLRKLVAAEVRVLRLQLRGDVDDRAAYLDRLYLRVYNGAGRTRLWIDDLEIAGAVQAEAAGSVPPEASLPEIQSADLAAGRAKPASGGQVSGSMLVAGGRPIFPRIIQYQGEPLEFLKARGFNGVRLTTPPTTEFLDQARRAGLWIVCPPPRPPDSDSGDGTAHLDAIGPEYDGVLAWHLGQGLIARDLETTRRLAAAVRQADRQAERRPLVCSASAELRAYSRAVDVLLLDRFPLGTSFELTAYRNWLVERPRLALPRTQNWATIQTEPATAHAEQLAAVAGGRAPPIGAGSEGPRLLVYSALAAGARGVLFASQSPLDGADPQTRFRALLLESLNLELEAVEPWVGGGSFVTAVTGSDPNVVGAVLRTERAHLVLPMWMGRGAQCVPGQAEGADLTLVVPGVPGNNDAFELAPGGLRPLRHRRVTGGTSVTLDEFGLTAIVVLTQDPLALGSATRMAAPLRRAAQLESDMAALKLETDAATAARLARVSRPSLRADAALAAARTALQAADAHLAAGNSREALTQTRRAMRSLRTLERAEWYAAIGPLDSTVSSPFAAVYSTLPEHAVLAANIESARRLPNCLPEGSFENLDRLRRAGWQNFEHAQQGIRTEAELSRSVRVEGLSSLRLAAAPIDPKTSPGLVETPPMWITSPSVPVERGQLIRIHGHVRAPAAITGSQDGLLIIDSLGGEALAERIVQTDDWREFTLYRVATSGQVSVTFALTGYGEVWIDDVTIEPLGRHAPPPAGPQLSTGLLPVRRLPAVR